MHIYQLLFTYCALIFIWIIILSIKIKFLFLFRIAIINRLFFNFVLTLESNNFGAEGAKAIAETLKLNNKLTNINLSNIL